MQIYTDHNYIYIYNSRHSNDRYSTYIKKHDNTRGIHTEHTNNHNSRKYQNQSQVSIESLRWKGLQQCHINVPQVFLSTNTMGHHRNISRQHYSAKFAPCNHSTSISRSQQISSKIYQQISSARYNWWDMQTGYLQQDITLHQKPAENNHKQLVFAENHLKLLRHKHH